MFSTNNPTYVSRKSCAQEGVPPWDLRFGLNLDTEIAVYQFPNYPHSLCGGESSGTWGLDPPENI